MTLLSDVTRPPSWVNDSTFYQIFPDRFARSDSLQKPSNLEPWDSPPTVHGFKGGDLIGIVERLDWLTELGVNAIYLNPIFRSAANHRYHTHDYMHVDPLLGGDEAFDILISACHERDIRVVIDGVFNHTGRGFFQFNDLLENGDKSPWVDWYHIHGWPLRAFDEKKPPSYGAWWGMHALPELNTDNPRVREYVMSVAEYWIRRGADGWRLDVPEEIKTHGFWEEFRSRVRAANPEAYLVGEIWHEAGGWTNNGRRFDGVQNYVFTNSLLSFAAGSRIVDDVVEGITYQVRPPKDAGGYADAIDHLLRIYSKDATKSNLSHISSHDVPRALTAAGGDRDSVVLATMLMFTFPGPPCIYYGDEVGLEGKRDPDCRRSFPWDKPKSWDTKLLVAHRTLGALRQAHPALRRGEYRRLWPEPGQYGPMLYVFERSDPDETLLIAVNAGTESEKASFTGEAGKYTLLWGKGKVTVSANTHPTTVTLPARSGAVWKAD